VHFEFEAADVAADDGQVISQGPPTAQFCVLITSAVVDDEFENELSVL